MTLAINVQGGWTDGMPIRRARKTAYCHNWRNCEGTREIAPGGYYTEMEVDPDVAGGFGMKKLCMTCAGAEARNSLAAGLALT
jgi:hypothetical protein